MPRQRLCLLTITTILCTAGFAAAQTADPVFNAQGFQINRDYFSQLPFENIDTLTGNLVLTFTDIVLPGNAGMNLKIQRTFNLNAPIPSSPWTFGVSGLPSTIRVRTGPCTYDTPQYPVIVGSDGAEHQSVLDQFGTYSTADFWRYDIATHRKRQTKTVLTS